MIQNNKMIVIGSTGRNNGKTEFACRLIAQLSKHQRVFGVKVTTIREDGSECPRGGEGCGVCSSLDHSFKITEERNDHRQKDTERMVVAGAEKVLWLRVRKKSLPEGLNELLKNIPKDVIVVCESNSVRLVLDPGLFLIIRSSSDNVIKQSCRQVYQFADKILYFNGCTWTITPDRIQFVQNRWIIREKATAIILAGGKSLRMGQDKSLLQIKGETLIQSITNQLVPFFDEVIIGANEPEKYRFLNFRIVPDIEKNKGPLMGLLSCLKSSGSEINFVTACDIPIMNIAFIRYMISLAGKFDIVMPRSSEVNYETLFAVYNKNITNAAEEILKDNKRRIIELFKKASVSFVDFKHDGWYENLNTRQNYIDFLEKHA